MYSGNEPSAALFSACDEDAESVKNECGKEHIANAFEGGESMVKGFELYTHLKHEICLCRSGCAAEAVFHGVAHQYFAEQGSGV